MMKQIAIALTLILPTLVFAQNQNCQTLPDFSTIQVYDGISATFERSDSNTICGSATISLDDLDISTENGVLRIRKKAGNKYDKQPAIKINYAQLNRIEGYANASLDTRNLIKSDSLTIILKTGSTFYADCDVKYLNAEVIEGSLLKIDGYAVEQVIQSSGNATFSGFELEGETADVKAVRTGKVKLNITKKISGSAGSGGYIGYKGSPRTNVKTSFGGKIVKEIE